MSEMSDDALKKLLEREDIKRWGRSVGERAAARAEARFKELAKKPKKRPPRRNRA